ncbi:MAG: hypothetical protein JSW34_13190 [Candidatus Zixiibacteriota bacterium]|nr:MAG: hypothetical protein JSW34_13190 [candidate division Zixibacteria bacterium]
MNTKALCLKIILLSCLTFQFAASAYASSAFTDLNHEHLKLKYSLVQGQPLESTVLAQADDSGALTPSGEAPGRNYKSPAKAFLLSLAVPGLGQYYYGSRVKPFLFLGAETAAWIFHIRWHNEGEDITAEFEAFNRQHWIPERYEDYLFYVYGVRDDEEVPPNVVEVTHNLPDTRTQQYYEMTGKYDQFAWGWDDARLDGQDLHSGVPAIVNTPETTPYSANRLHYESRRNDANNAFDRATRMIFVSMVNRIFSAFEALYTTSKINREARQADTVFSQLRFSAKLKSYHVKRDTPFLTVTYKF